MISLYDFTDYRELLNSWIADRGPGGRGLQGKIAKACGISSTMVSLILKGNKHLTLEQATELADFLGLSDSETDYFYLMVEHGRAGTFKLQQRLSRRLKEAQNQAKKVSHRIKKDMELNEEVKAIFYSSWIYSGIRLLSALEDFHNPHAIAGRLNLPPSIVKKIVDFLVENGLCKMQGHRLTYGPSRTHIDNDSPFVTKHHQNWRVRGFGQMDSFKESDLFFTGPLCVSVEAAEEIRRLLPNMIEQIMKIAGPSRSEKLQCLNIDWFEF
jgi:uncharacterized protein (TIGR02147 family)